MRPKWFYNYGKRLSYKAAYRGSLNWWERLVLALFHRRYGRIKHFTRGAPCDDRR